MSIEDICAFVSLSDKLATAGQPSEEQIPTLAENGFNVVINLGLQDPRYCIPDEEGLVTWYGMSYHHIPVEFSTPTKEDINKFFQVMDDCQDEKVFVHCAANYRASCFVAMYGQARYGWSERQAMEFIRGVWEPDRVWLEFMNNSKVMIDQAT